MIAGTQSAMRSALSATGQGCSRESLSKKLNSRLSASPGHGANIEELKLLFHLFSAPLGAGELRTDRPSELSEWAAAGIWAACVASGLDLLVCSHVGLGCL